MTMRAARFSQADINRAVIAVKKACGSAVVEMGTDGTIVVKPADLSPQSTPSPSPQGEKAIAPKREWRL